MIMLSKPICVDAETLHRSVDQLDLGPYCIRWHVSTLVFHFDRELTEAEEDSLRQVVADHDGSEAIAIREEQAAKIAAIQAANKALVESARAKRLAGLALSQAELAALVDAVLFPG